MKFLRGIQFFLVPNEVKTLISDTPANLTVQVPVQVSSPTTKPSIEWVEIPGGTFLMGSPANEPGRQGDEDQIQITISPFKMSKYEITFAQYDLFVRKQVKLNLRIIPGEGKQTRYQCKLGGCRCFCQMVGLQIAYRSRVGICL